MILKSSVVIIIMIIIKIITMIIIIRRAIGPGRVRPSLKGGTESARFGCAESLAAQCVDRIAGLRCPLAVKLALRLLCVWCYVANAPRLCLKLLALLLHLTFTLSQVHRVVICEVVPTRSARQRTNHETDKSQLSS